DVLPAQPREILGPSTGSDRPDARRSRSLEPPTRTPRQGAGRATRTVARAPGRPHRTLRQRGRAGAGDGAALSLLAAARRVVRAVEGRAIGSLGSIALRRVTPPRGRALARAGRHPSVLLHEQAARDAPAVRDIARDGGAGDAAHPSVLASP